MLIVPSRDALLERGFARLRDHGVTARPISSELPPAQALMQVARHEHADMIIVVR